VTTGTLGEFDVTAMLRALSQKSGSDLLSAPKVTVLSGDLATIKVAQELLYLQRYSDIEPEVGSGSSLSGGTSGGSAGVVALPRISRRVILEWSSLLRLE